MAEEPGGTGEEEGTKEEDCALLEEADQGGGVGCHDNWKEADRKIWKGMVRERMKHLAEWEDSKGKKWEGEEVVRSQPQKVEFVFVCEVCGKVCKNKGGLTVHRRAMHERSALKKLFPCHRCGTVFQRDANLMNHLAVCEGEECEGDSKKCNVCEKWLKKKSFSKQGEAHTMPIARRHVPKTSPCPSCGRELSTTNMARHLKICRN